MVSNENITYKLSEYEYCKFTIPIYETRTVEWTANRTQLIDQICQDRFKLRYHNDNSFGYLEGTSQRINWFLLQL